jgi:hypothetical protein
VNLLDLTSPTVFSVFLFVMFYFDSLTATSIRFIYVVSLALNMKSLSLPPSFGAADYGLLGVEEDDYLKIALI